MDKGNPGIQFIRKSHQPIRIGREGLHQGLKQAYPYRELDHHWPQASQGVYPCLAIHSHRLLGKLTFVVLILFPQLLELGLETGHGPHLAYLSQGEGCSYQAYEDGKGYDGQAHVAEQHGVQEHQAVDHGPEDALIPDVGKQICEYWVH